MEFKASKNKDLRMYVIAPIRCITDKRLKPSELKILLLICSYCDRTGVTWVSHDRLALDYGCSRQYITKITKKLRDYGYLVHAKRRHKDQKSNSTKVIYDIKVRTPEDAFSNLPAWQQMEHQEDQPQPSEVAYPKGQPQPESITAATSRELPKQINNIYINNSIGEVRRETVISFLSRYTKLGQTLGQHRDYDSRAMEVMTHWIREGLTELQWIEILNQHLKFCRDKRRPIANSVGYFKIPVEKILSKTGSHKINNIIKDLGRKFKS